MKKKYFSDEERKEAQKKYKQKYYQSHKETMLKYSHEYNESHREQVNALINNWRYNNINDNGISYAQFHNQATPIINKLKKHCNYTCEVCGTSAQDIGKRRIHGHHIVPFKENGTNDPDNILIVCDCCHKLVEGKDWEFIDEIRREMNKI